MTRRLLTTIGVVALIATSAYTNHLWAQKGVGDIALAPGQSSTLNFKVYCLEYGMPLTNEPVEFKGRSGHGVVEILHYAHSKGYVDNNPVQVQLAIWRQRTGEWKAADHAVAEEILKNASQVPTETKPGGDVFLTDAAKAGTVQVAVSEMAPVNVPNSPVTWPWLGAGRMTVTNKAKENVTVERMRPYFFHACINGTMMSTLTRLWYSIRSILSRHRHSPESTQAVFALPIVGEILARSPDLVADEHFFANAEHMLPRLLA